MADLTASARIVLESTDSTMREAVRQAPSLAAPTWISARTQTAATGRRGRAWSMPEGNLAATLVYRPTGQIQDWPLRSFVAALALRDALRQHAGPHARIALKWPNDVLLNGGKVAGILLEAHPPFLSVGIGVNLLAAPSPQDVEPRAVRPVSLADETGLVTEPDVFLDALAASYADWEARLVTYGFAPIRTAWMADAAKLGQSITARTGTAETTGTFDQVDAHGHLVLNTPQGRVSIPAADIFF